MSITPTYPGVYIQEVPSGVRTITGVATSITAFVGRALRGPVDEPRQINSFADFERIYGGLWSNSTMSYAVRDFYMNGGSTAIIVRLVNDAEQSSVGLSTPTGTLTLEAKNPGSWGDRLLVEINHDTADTSDDSLFNIIVTDTETGAIERFLNVSIDPDSPRVVNKVLEQRSDLINVRGALPSDRPDPVSPTTPNFTNGSDGNSLDNDSYVDTGFETQKRGLFQLEKVDLFNLLCIPPRTRDNDVGSGVLSSALEYCIRRRAILLLDPPSDWSSKDAARTGMSSFPLSGDSARNAAIYFPRLRISDPLQDGRLVEVAPCGAVAGVIARTDAQRGVWKAPAGQDATLNGVVKLSIPLTDEENGELNPLGLNVIRSFPIIGRVVWGARTLRGADALASEWKYLPVRRLALFLEESLYRGTQWVVFEPNDEPLWAQIRLNLGAFMHDLFRKGAFAGQAPRDAYFVKCDKETTTQNDINNGIVNIIVGFAPLKPAEFVIIKIQQIAGDIES